MTKILNLDKIETKNEKAIELNGKVHNMRTFTVKEYLYHMKEASKLAKIDETDEDSLTAGVNSTIKILMEAFPSITQDEFEALSMKQLEAIMEYIDNSNAEDLEGSESGETAGKVA